MARIAFIIIFTLLISIAGYAYSNDTKTSLPSNEYFSDRNVEIITTVSENKIQLARKWDVLLYQGFDEHGEDQKHQKDIGRTHIFRWEYSFTDGWKFTNFKNALKASIYKENDTKNAYLDIHGSENKDDTAFELITPEIIVEPGKEYILSFRCKLNNRIIRHSGFKGNYETGIIWLASDNKIIDETPFSLLNEEGTYKEWYTRKIEVISPERATKAMIRFGFDLPNLGPGDFVCFDDIRFATLSNRYEPEGEFISRPLRVAPGKLSFLPKADMPTGTSIQFQLRFAENNNGVPGTWTSFIDHNQMTTLQSPPSQGGDFVVSAQSNDEGEVKSRLSSSLPSQGKEEGLLIPPFTRERGSVIDYPPSIPPFARGDTGGCKINFPEKEVFTQENYKWLQYQAILHTTKPDTTPALHSVIINSANGTSITDSGWSGPDTTPPEIVWRSPTRTEKADAPIAFRLCDNPGGLGIKSVEAYLNGEKVALLLGKSNENEYILKTTGPLKPLERDTGLYAWKIENYQNALAVERSPEIVTFINNSESTSYVDTAFKELKDAGFNTAHTYMKERNNDFAEFYSTAARYGMKVLVMSSAGHNSTDIDTIVHDVATEVDQPALLSWYLADDTSGYISSKDLKNIHEIIKDINPYHLTSQADAVGFVNKYQRYADATDIFLPELYLVRNKGKEDIAELIRDMKNVKEEVGISGCNQGIWAIVQDFKGWGWERYPTDEEVRAMTYLSIIHGATGIMYYTYGGWGENFGAPFDEYVWANLKKVVGEIAYLHDVLAERNTKEHCASFIIEGPQKDGMGYPALNTLLKVYQGKHYLFAANSAQQPIRCQFKPTTGNISEVSVMFEGRTLPVKDGVFVDDFKPYDVHVYRW